MAICIRCDSNQPRPCPWTGRTREFYRAMIAALRYRARSCGYALAVHGSLRTDIDLVAVPWRDSCVRPEYLAEEIRKTAEQIIGFASERSHDPSTQKPCGRRAWSFYLQPEGMEGPYIDLSVIAPSVPQPREGETR